MHQNSFILNTLHNSLCSHYRIHRSQVITFINQSSSQVFFVDWFLEFRYFPTQFTVIFAYKSECTLTKCFQPTFQNEFLPLGCKWVKVLPLLSQSTSARTFCWTHAWKMVILYWLRLWVAILQVWCNIFGPQEAVKRNLEVREWKRPRKKIRIKHNITVKVS